MEPTPSARPRAAKACIICHKKKIKCDLDITKSDRCSACTRDGYECRPRERKRKRIYTLDSESPPPKTRPESALLSPKNGNASQLGASTFSQRSARNIINYQPAGV